MDKTKLINFITKEDWAAAKEYIVSELDSVSNDIEIIKYLGLCNINLGCVQDAIYNFETVVKEDEEDALSLYYLATLYMDTNELKVLLSAVDIFKKVIELREDYIDAYKMLCICYIRLRKFSAIIELKDKMLSICNDDYGLYDLFSTAYFEMKMFDEAIEIQQTALEYTEAKDSAYFKIGVYYFNKNAVKTSIEYFEKAVAIDDNESTYLYHLGLAYYTSENFVEAEKNLKKAIELTDNNTIYMILYANAALKAQKYEGAIDVLEKLIKQNPNNDTHKYNLACAYEGANQLEQASKIIEKLLTFNLNSNPLKMYLADLYAKRGMVESAKVLYSDIISSGFTTPDVLYQYAVLCVKANESDAGEDIFKKLIKDNPKWAIPYKDLAIIYLGRKFFDRAAENFAKAYELEPDNISIVYEYANYFHLMADFKKAQELYDNLLDKYNLSATMLGSVALNCISLNQIDKAKELLEKAIKMEPQNVNVLFYLAQVYFIKKNFENAKQLLEDAYTLMASPEIANLLAQVYFELGNYKKALPLFLVINQTNPANSLILMCVAKCLFELEKYAESKIYVEDLLKLLPEHDEAMELLEKINAKLNA